MYTNGKQKISGKRIEVDGRVILNPTPEMLADAGWTKVIPAEPSEEELARMERLAECVACNLPMPYDAEALHSERQAIRDRINELEGEE